MRKITSIIVVLCLLICMSTSANSIGRVVSFMLSETYVEVLDSLCEELEIEVPYKVSDDGTIVVTMSIDEQYQILEKLSNNIDEMLNSIDYEANSDSRVMRIFHNRDFTIVNLQLDNSEKQMSLGDFLGWITIIIYCFSYHALAGVPEEKIEDVITVNWLDADGNIYDSSKAAEDDYTDFRFE